MEEKKYSWGELYETTKEMEEKGEKIISPLLQKFFALFHELDNAKTIAKVYKIISDISISTEEQNYINSSCLDGILLSIEYDNPLCNLIEQRKEYVETCKYYLSKGFVKRALFRAIEYNKPKIVELLLKYRANPNKVKIPSGSFGGRCPLFMAIKSKNIDIIRILIENGAKVTYELLDTSIAYENVEIFKLLFNTRRLYEDYENDATGILHAAIYEYRDNEQILEMIEFLLQNGAEFDEESIEQACFRGYKNLWELLCKYNCPSSEILESAISESNVEAVKVILTYNVAITTKCWQTAIKKSGNCTIEKLLLKYDENITISEEDATKMLKKECTEEMIDILCEKGISFDTITKNIPMFNCIKSLIETKYTLVPKET